VKIRTPNVYRPYRSTGAEYSTYSIVMVLSIYMRPLQGCRYIRGKILQSAAILFAILLTPCGNQAMVNDVLGYSPFVRRLDGIFYARRFWFLALFLACWIY